MADPELSIAGEPLLYDVRQQAASFLRNYQPLDDLLVQVHESISAKNSRDTSVGISRVGLPRPNYPAPPPPRINQLYWPTGASRWAQGYFLATKSVADKLSLACGSAVELIARVNDVSIRAKVFVMAPRPVSCVAATAHESLYLIPVVDDRYWWQFRNYGNMGKPTITTWNALFSHVVDRLGIQLTVDSFSSSYLKPDPEEFTRRYDNAAAILDAMALSVGQRIVRQFDGTVRSINFANSAAEYDANLASRTPWWQIAGDSVASKPIPASVQVVFPRADCGIPSCNRQVYLSTVPGTTYSQNCPVAGSVKTIHSTAWANYEPSATTPLNVAELDSLAEQIASDYYASLARQYDHTFIGTKQWFFTAFDDHALISCGIEDSVPRLEADTRIFDKAGDCTAQTEIRLLYSQNYITRVQSFPQNFGVDQMLHQGTVTVRIPAGVVAMELNGGQCLHPGGSALATYLDWDPGANDWVLSSPACPVTVYDPFYRNFVLAGERFWARFGCDSGHLEIVGENGLMRRGKASISIACGASGLVLIHANNPDAVSCVPPPALCSVVACNTWNCSRTVNANSEVIVKFFERVWQILPVGANSLIRFELLAPLALGGSSTATEIGTGPAFNRIGNPFPIKDPWKNPGMWRYDPGYDLEQRGYMGWCIIPSDAEVIDGDSVREIVWMEQLAAAINFKLLWDLEPKGVIRQAEADVNFWYQGKDPSTSNLATGTINNHPIVTVYDISGNYPKALAGAAGKARYNNKEHRYEIIECNQMAMIAIMLLGKFCSYDIEVPVIENQIFGMTFPPYGQTPPLTIASVTNLFGLGQAFESEALCIYDWPNDRWVIVQVFHDQIDIPRSLAFYKFNCGLALTTRLQRVAVMTCDADPEDLTESVDMTSMDVVTGYSISHTAGSGGSGSLGPTEGTCNRIISKTKICAFLDDSGGSTTTITPLNAVLVMQDIYVDGTCIGATVAVVYVECEDPPDEVIVICGTDCASSGSS